MSLRRKHLGILSELVPAGIVGVSMLVGSTAPSPAFGGATARAANEASVLDRLSSAVEGAESSHGGDPHMWRPELEGPQGPMQVSAAAATDVGGGDRFDDAQNRALGRRVSDEFRVPLCREHHRELHRHGDEVRWWHKLGLDPTPAARALWLETHPPGANKFAYVAVDPDGVSPVNR